MLSDAVRPSHPARAPAGYARGGRAPHFQQYGYSYALTNARSLKRTMRVSLDKSLARP